MRAVEETKDIAVCSTSKSCRDTSTESVPSTCRMGEREPRNTYTPKKITTKKQEPQAYTINIDEPLLIINTESHPRRVKAAASGRLQPLFLLLLANSTLQRSSFTGHEQQPTNWHAIRQQHDNLLQQETTGDPIRDHENPKRIGQLIPITAKALAKSSTNLKADTISQHLLHLNQQRAFNGLSKKIR
ncbi:hypothetical protein Nepgr_007927 [Nepenthes gracilis]|uniref:Uncharacterized protein n=1 Tax=Nepenthes gracilis TaxID=150966 RepID=A0AAD3XIQ7_NEPGR|nr:hypothetical protein Nepgr_007927 [Nepenthes gracilis]